MHGNRGRLPASAVPLDIKNKIISLYINDFSGANFTLFCEIMQSDLRIKISDTTLNNWMKAEEVLSPKYLMEDIVISFKSFLIIKVGTNDFTIGIINCNMQMPHFFFNPME